MSQGTDVLNYSDVLDPSSISGFVPKTLCNLLFFPHSTDKRNANNFLINQVLIHKAKLFFLKNVSCHQDFCSPKSFSHRVSGPTSSTLQNETLSELKKNLSLSEL